MALTGLESILHVSYNRAMKNSLNKHIDEFLTYLEVEKDRSATTVRNYTHWLMRFSRWAAEYGITDSTYVTPEAIKRFKTSIMQMSGGNSLQKNTVNYHLIALRSFFSYLNNRGVATLPKHKIVLFRIQPREQNPTLDATVLKRLIETAANSNESQRIKKRDMAILALLLSSDLRVSELASLLRSDIRLPRKECVSRRGNSYQVCQLSRETCDVLQAYLEQRKDSCPQLFIRLDRAGDNTTTRSDTTFALTPRSIQRIVSKYARLAGIEQTVTPEILRRTALIHR